MSSQLSARAGEAENAANSASSAASRIGRRSCRRDVIGEGPFVAIEANERGERKGKSGATLASSAPKNVRCCFSKTGKVGLCAAAKLRNEVLPNFSFLKFRL